MEMEKENEAVNRLKDKCPRCQNLETLRIDSCNCKAFWFRFEDDDPQYATKVWGSSAEEVALRKVEQHDDEYAAMNQPYTVYVRASQSQEWRRFEVSAEARVTYSAEDLGFEDEED